MVDLGRALCRLGWHDWGRPSERDVDVGELRFGPLYTWRCEVCGAIRSEELKYRPLVVDRIYPYGIDDEAE